MAQSQTISSATAKIIDEEIRDLVESAYKHATKILTDNLEDLHKLGKGLLEYETLSGEEIKDLLAGKVIQQKTEDDDETDGKPAGSVPSTKKPKKKSDNIGSDPIPES